MDRAQQAGVRFLMAAQRATRRPYVFVPDEDEDRQPSGLVVDPDPAASPTGDWSSGDRTLFFSFGPSTTMSVQLIGDDVVSDVANHAPIAVYTADIARAFFQYRLPSDDDDRLEMRITVETLGPAMAHTTIELERGTRRQGLIEALGRMFCGASGKMYAFDPRQRPELLWTNFGATAVTAKELAAAVAQRKRPPERLAMVRALHRHQLPRDVVWHARGYLGARRSRRRSRRRSQR